MTERGFHPFAVLHFLRKTILLYLLPLLQVLFARNWAALRTALVQGAANKLCTGILYDKHGQPHVCIDEYMKRHLEIKLISSIVTKAETV